MNQNQSDFQSIYVPSRNFFDSLKVFCQMATKTGIVAFKKMTQDFVKSDQFDETNFTSWQNTMIFLLTSLKISNVLDPDLLPFPKPTDLDTESIKVNTQK